MSSVLIKGITLDDFIRYGGEYAAYLDGTGCTVELPDHGDLIEKTYVVNAIKRDLAIKSEEYLLPAEKTLFNEICNAPAIIPAERTEDGET